MSGNFRITACYTSIITLYNNRKKKQALLDASKKVGLKVNPQKTKSVLLSHYQKAGQKHRIKMMNRSFVDVAKFRYLETTMTDQNYTHEAIRSTQNLGNACYYLVRSLVFPPVVQE
jgi:hypothetical protein